MADAYRIIARIQKAHGRNGEVVAVPAHGLPLLLHKGLEVALLPPDLKGPRWHTIDACVQAKSGQLVSFEDVTTLDAASKIVGKSVLVNVDCLPDDWTARDPNNLYGREVVDGRLGLLGSIAELMRGPANDVWVVDGPYGEVLIPAVEPIVVRLDPDGPILVDAPRGLVDEEGEERCY